MGEAVVAPGTPDAVRHHDPRKDRQRGPARRLDLGEERGGFKGDAARRGDDKKMMRGATSARRRPRARRMSRSLYQFPKSCRRCYTCLVSIMELSHDTFDDGRHVPRDISVIGLQVINWRKRYD